jgi:hypothetical protein
LVDRLPEFFLGHEQQVLVVRFSGGLQYPAGVLQIWPPFKDLRVGIQQIQARIKNWREQIILVYFKDSAQTQRIGHMKAPITPFQLADLHPHIYMVQLRPGVHGQVELGPVFMFALSVNDLT